MVDKKKFDKDLYKLSLRNKINPKPVYRTPEIKSHLLDKQQQMLRQDVGVLEWVGTHIENDWLTRWVFKGQEEFIPDKNYQLTDEKWDELTVGIPSDYWENFLDAQSDAQANYIRDDILKRLKAEETLMAWGWGGIAARFAGSFLDPITLAATIGTGGIYKLKTIQEMNRIRRMMTMGTITGSEAALHVGIQAVKDPLLDKDDVVTAAAIGGTLGGLLGGLSYKKGVRFEDTMSDPLEKVDNRPAIIKDAQEEMGVSGKQGEFPFEQAQKAKDDAPLFAPENTDTVTADISDKLNEIGKVSKTRSELKREIEKFNKENPDRAISTTKTIKTKKGKEVTKDLDKKELLQNIEDAKVQKKLKDKFTDSLYKNQADEIEADKGNKTINNKEIDDEAGANGLTLKGKDLEDAAENFQAAPQASQSAINLPFNLPFIGNKLRLRYGMAAKLKTSSSGLVRHIARKTYRDSHADWSKADKKFVASETTIQQRMRQQNEETLGPVLQQMEDSRRAMQKAAKGSNLKYGAGSAKEDEMFDEVAALVRSGKIDEAANGPVKDLAIAVRKYFKEMNKYAKDTKIRNADEVPDNAAYLPRIHDLKKIDALTGKFSEKDVINIYAEMMDDLGGELTLEMRQALSKGLLRKVRSGENGYNHRASVIADDIDDIEEYLLDVITDKKLANEIVTIIKKNFGKRTGDKAGTISRFRRRIQLDETKTVAIKDKDGNVHNIGINDLTNTNLRDLMMRYDRMVRGQGEMNNLLEELSKIAGVKLTKWSQVRKLVEAEGKHNLKNMKVIDIDDLEYTRREILGIPKSKTNHGLSAFRDLQFSVIGGSFGIASLPEYGYITAHGRHFLNAVPAYKKITKAMTDGTFSKEGLRDFFYLTGVGNDRLMMQMGGKVAPDELSKTGWRSRLVRGVADISGLNAITKNQQQMMANVSLQALANDILGTTGKIFSPMKYLQLGLDQSMINRIRNVLKDADSGIKIIEVKGIGKVVDAGSLNVALSKSADQEAVSKLLMAIQKNVESSIQRTYTSDIPTFMSTDIGKLMGQFRTYSLTAYNVQFSPQVQRIRSGDFKVFNQWANTFFLASANYTLWTYLRNIGDKEKLEKYLTPAQILKGGLVQMGAANIIPAFIDMFASFVGDPIFINSRQSKLPSSLLTGNPSTTWLDKLKRGSEGILQGLLWDDKDVSKSNIKDITSTLPFSRHPFLQIPTNYMIDQSDLK